MKSLFRAHVGNHLAVLRVESRLRDIACKCSVVILYGEHGRLGLFEHSHYLLHGVVDAEFRCRLNHELRHLEVVIQFGAEHYVANVVYMYLAAKSACRIEHREYRHLAAAYGVDKALQGHVGGDEDKLRIDDTLKTHKRQCGVVRMVGYKFSLAGKTHAVNAVRFKNYYSKVRAYANHHKWYEHSVAASKFGNKEHTRQRGVHDTRHHRCHSQHGEVLLGNIDAYLFHVPHAGEEEASQSAYEQRGRESTAAASAAVCRRRGEDLCGKDEEDVDDEPLAVAGEDGVVHNFRPVGFGLSAKKDVDAGVPFAVECREEEDERAEDNASQKEPLVRVVQTGEDALAEVHGAYEVKANKTAKDPQKDICRRTFYHPAVTHGEVEQRVGAGEEIAEEYCRDGTDKDRQQRRHSKVYHKHLEGEHQSGDGGFEDTRNGSGGTTAYEEHQRAVVHLERLTQIAANGGAGKHDRSLGTHGTSEADGYCRRYDGAPHVVGFQTAAL